MIQVINEYESYACIWIMILIPIFCAMFIVMTFSQSDESLGGSFTCLVVGYAPVFSLKCGANYARKNK